MGIKKNRGKFSLNDPCWADNLATLTSARIPAVGGPTWTAFGPSGDIYQYAFSKGDVAFLAFHINHDIAEDSPHYFHVHWTTDGTHTGNVVWEIEYMYARGHDQEAFPAPTTITLTQAGSGTAWQHMIVECTDDEAFTVDEPDGLVLVMVSRKNVAADTNTDTVFGLFVDLHYQADRVGTPQKAPDFYED